MRIGGSVMKPYASPKEWLALVRELGYSAVIFPVDSSAERYRNASAFIAKCFDLLGPHIRSIHVKDLLLDDLILPVCIREVPPGQGSIDLALALRLAAKLEDDVPVFIEHLDSHEAYLAAPTYMRALAQRL